MTRKVSNASPLSASSFSLLFLSLPAPPIPLSHFLTVGLDVFLCKSVADDSFEVSVQPFSPPSVYRTSLPESCRDESTAPPPVVCFWAHHSLALSTFCPSFLLLNHTCSLRPPLSSSAHGFLMKADDLA